MAVYYNEIDQHAAQWLRELIANNLIAPGDVDERSIEDVRPDELRGYTQCHFFAGIGGWAYALALAGWPRDRPVWTGSCPCQPFSAAGKGAGFEDERHLWPACQHLIAQCKPPVVFGEQVASKHADAWIDLVHADMEGMGYAFGCIPFPAAGVGAPHIRDRNFWVADSLSWLAEASRYADAKSSGRGEECQNEGWGNYRNCTEGLSTRLVHGGGHFNRGPCNGQWSNNDWIECIDGKWRPIKSGIFPLAHGVPARMGRLRGYGNAIVPQQAAEFICAYLDTRLELEIAA